jgi:hypothetical protein
MIPTQRAVAREERVLLVVVPLSITGIPIQWYSARMVKMVGVMAGFDSSMGPPAAHLTGQRHLHLNGARPKWRPAGEVFTFASSHTGGVRL